MLTFNKSTFFTELPNSVFNEIVMGSVEFYCSQYIYHFLNINPITFIFLFSHFLQKIHQGTGTKESINLY